ncbi:hypothetical protein [Nocardiopsis prasina]|uniref:hypothetical protein n=1 Tax=Nocardiopsis prasina TaxID=2015 RepID=UPI0003473A6C|nr:hypothetical protein [Nocardiopsis prasina]
MDDSKKSLDDLVRDELGDEPSQEAKDYARELYERYRLPATDTGVTTEAPKGTVPTTADD